MNADLSDSKAPCLSSVMITVVQIQYSSTVDCSIVQMSRPELRHGGAHGKGISAIGAWVRRNQEDFVSELKVGWTEGRHFGVLPAMEHPPGAWIWVGL